MRSILSIRFLSIRAFVPAACLFSALTLTAQPAAQTPPPPSQTPATPASPATLTRPPVSKEPDYPDPRSIVIGIYDTEPLFFKGPDIKGGNIASQEEVYENLYGLGRPYRIVPEVEVGVPITRTGMIFFDIERLHGQGNQTLTRDSFVDSFSFLAGDTIDTQFHYITFRVYLEDLLYPHAFPVRRLRFRSIWGARYLNLTQAIDSPSEDTTAGVAGNSFETAGNHIFTPEFGLAAEYALTPHVLFRVDGAGFGIPHHSDLGEASAMLSWRHKNLEFLAGAKMLHFKTSPQKEEYLSATYVTPTIGLRWHW